MPSASSPSQHTHLNTHTQWLGLREGYDYSELVDLAGLYRIWNAKYRTYSVFSQDHLAKVLLGRELGAHVAHDAAGDALKSIQLYKLHRQMKPNEIAWKDIEVWWWYGGDDRRTQCMCTMYTTYTSYTTYTIYTTCITYTIYTTIPQQKLLEEPPAPSFAKLNPTHEGVCMGNRKTCTCGAVFFG